MKQLVLIVTCIFSFQHSFAQYKISGHVVDENDNSPLIGVPVSVTSAKVNAGAITNEQGNFILSGLGSEKYSLSISYLGYQERKLEINLIGDYSLGALKLKRENTTLKTVTIEDQQTRAQQHGDTVQFNADAYKVHPEATAEDLLKKMPGITSDNNGIKVNGEDVKKVLVDGKPFFGDDPNTALKNLPAEIVDKIEVYDNQSDQARFTGFKDANAEKAINIMTKNGKNAGEFGKIYAGYGTSNRYLAGGSLNIFDGSRRISILGLSNNVNQQNFSTSDIMNVMSNSGQGMAPPSDPPPIGMSGNSFGKKNTGNFGFGPGGLLVGQQNGVTATQSAGINYTDSWGKKINVTASYFFNYTDNNSISELSRKYFTDTTLKYTENTTKHTINQNHRFNLRFEYAIDSYNVLTVTPSITFQQNKYTTRLAGTNKELDNLLGVTNTTDTARNSGYSFSNNILLQHKFHKRGRTISVNIGTQVNSRNGAGGYNSLNEYQTYTNALDQHYNTASKDYKVSGTLAYTEPLGSYTQLMYSYTPTYTKGQTDKETNNKDTLSNEYVDLDTSLSNKYQNTYQTHRTGLSLRHQKGKLNFSFGIDYQYAELKGSQDFPMSFNTLRRFNSVLPSATFEYRFNRTQNIFFSYRTANTSPSLSQLQNVVDISNPLQLSSGNTDLRQTNEHLALLRYGKTNSATSRNLFVFATANYVRDYISNATILPYSDTVINNTLVARGSQLTMPVNLNNYWAARSFLVYSLPISVIKSNLNLNGGITYTHTPGLVNSILNYTNNYAVNGGVYLGSNISQNIDFSLSYNGSYNITNNTAQNNSDNKYYNHTANFKVNWIVRSRLVLNSDLSHIMYAGLADGYNQSMFLWNASIGYKFLSRALELKAYVYDIFNQNSNAGRTITETYSQDTKYNVLKRYGMLSLTYTIRNFKNGSTQPRDNFRPPPGMPPPSSMPPPKSD